MGESANAAENAFNLVQSGDVNHDGLLTMREFVDADQAYSRMFCCGNSPVPVNWVRRDQAVRHRHHRSSPCPQ